MSAPRKRWVCRVEIEDPKGDRITLDFPVGESRVFPAALSCLVTADPPPVLGVFWKEEGQ